MTASILNRRTLLAAGSSFLAAGASGLLLPAHAQGLAPTASMPGGANNYHAHRSWRASAKAVS
jgi:hypothetical protein